MSLVTLIRKVIETTIKKLDKPGAIIPVIIGTLQSHVESASPKPRRQRDSINKLTKSIPLGLIEIEADRYIF